MQRQRAFEDQKHFANLCMRIRLDGGLPNDEIFAHDVDAVLRVAVLLDNSDLFISVINSSPTLLLVHALLTMALNPLERLTCALPATFRVATVWLHKLAELYPQELFKHRVVHNVVLSQQFSLIKFLFESACMPRQRLLVGVFQYFVFGYFLDMSATQTVCVPETSVTIWNKVIDATSGPLLERCFFLVVGEECNARMTKSTSFRKFAKLWERLGKPEPPLGNLRLFEFHFRGKLLTFAHDKCAVLGEFALAILVQYLKMCDKRDFPTVANQLMQLTTTPHVYYTLMRLLPNFLSLNVGYTGTHLLGVRLCGNLVNSMSKTFREENAEASAQDCRCILTRVMREKSMQTDVAKRGFKHELDTYICNDRGAELLKQYLRFENSVRGLWVLMCTVSSDRVIAPKRLRRR